MSVTCGDVILLATVHECDLWWCYITNYSAWVWLVVMLYY